MEDMNRRDLLKLAAAAAMAATPASAAAQAAPPADTLRFFPGFTSARVKTSGAEINLVHAGSGPPLLLMHGAPQTHVPMRLIAADLAKDYGRADGRPVEKRHPIKGCPPRSAPRRRAAGARHG